MGKKKHKEQNLIFQKFVRELTESGATIHPLLIGCTAGSFVDIQRKVFQRAFSQNESADETLPLGGGTVRTARVTSKGISFRGRRHYNSDYIQKFCGREVLIHEVGGKMKAYLYDETSKLLMRIICEVDISQVEMGNLVDGLSGSEASGRYSNW